MSNSTSPFRPRTPAVRLADLEAQLSRTCRRANADALLRALSPPVTILLVALSGLLVAALAGVSSLGFAVAFWGLVALVVLSVRRGLLRLRAGWIPRREAALRIDRRARLGDRLATLEAVRSTGRSSRLWPVLLRDNLEHLPRWKPHRLVPSLASPGVGVLFGALLVFLIVLQFLPSVPNVGPFPERPRDGAHAGREGTFVRAENTSEGGSGLGFLTGIPERFRSAVLGGGAGQPGGELLARGDVGEDGETVAGLPPGADGSNPGTFSGTPPDGGAASGALPSGAAPAGEGEGAPNEAIPMARGEDSPLGGDGFQRLPPVDVPPESEEPRAGQGPGAGSGAGSGADPEGLYGEGEGGSAAPDEFAFDLPAQGRRGDGDEREDRGGEERPAAELAREQRLDDAIRRARIPARYEEIVRRMFQREEGGGS